MMRGRFVVALGVGFGVLVAAQGAWAQSVPAPVFAADSVIASAQKDRVSAASALIKDFYAVLTETMKQGETLGFMGRFKKLEPVVKKTFNLPAMARFSVGPSWGTVQAEEQQRLIEAFSNFSVATYASRFTRYKGEAFDVVGERAAPQGGVIVETKLTPKGDAPVALNYLMRKDDVGQWRIMDVYLDASISELATRRSEYSAIIGREGFLALVEKLAAKNKKMGI